MNESEEEAGIIQVLAMRLETHRLPRALALKEKVDGGERLNDMDIAFLDEVFSDTARIKPMIDRHPEWQKVFIQMVQLYEGILSKAKENEQGAQ